MHGRASVFQTAENIAPFQSVDQYKWLIQWSANPHSIPCFSARKENLNLNAFYFYIAVIQNGCQKDDKYRLIGQEGSGILCWANN